MSTIKEIENFVEFSGYYSSYYGDTFDPKKTRIVTPKQVVKTVYE